MISKFLPLLAVLTSVAIAQNIEQVPAEKANKIAHSVTAALGMPADAPFAVDPDIEKPAAIKASGETGLLALPDRKLTPESLAAAWKSPLAVGHLWMRNVVPAVNSTAPDPAKLRTVAVPDKGNDVKIEVFYLGVTKSESGELNLGLYTKGKEPLVTAPLVKTDAIMSSTPISLDGHKEGEGAGVLVITVFGSYKADVTVTKPRE